ncbi:hypothetical protein LshimejAT787_1303870 [Lyophyllum shimeji]|uniref:Uncharacterized protein n=1 Tax=Lyophyllum shimeji TaxID=47721 RepID=A0A9P3PYJ2_LYOSH|nr:hypothetical protein LshimejAT787_1303870 [Lyophyllum shimeji]
MSSKENSYTVYDTSKKNRLIGAIMAGKSVVKAAALVKMKPSAAYAIIKKYRATGSTSNRRRSGRPSKLSDTDKCAIVRAAVKERRKPFCELANTSGLDISSSTVRNVLAEAGYH